MVRIIGFVVIFFFILKVLFYNSQVVDILDQPANKSVTVVLADNSSCAFDHLVLCSGHLWPKRHEDKIKGYYDSPYPPAKLKQILPQLKKDQIELIEMRFFESRSFKEIAEILGVTEANAKVKTHRVLAKIRLLLGVK